MGPKHLIIKKGIPGALLFHEDKCSLRPFHPWISAYSIPPVQAMLYGGFIGHKVPTHKKISLENMKPVATCWFCHGCVENLALERLKEIKRAGY